MENTTRSHVDLLDAVRLMNSNSDFTSVLEFILEISAKLLKAEDSSLFLLDHDEDGMINLCLYKGCVCDAV